MNEFTKNELKEIAQRQRKLLYAILAGIFLPLLVLPYQLWAIYKLAQALKLRAVWVWVLFTIVPLINLITLLIISQRAIRTLNAHGIKVGFMGADTKAL